MLLKYLIIINIINFIMFGIDKAKAKKNKWRIPESTLLGLSFLGGALGALIGMRFFRHKTKKKKFTIGIPIFLFINIATIIYGLFNYGKDLFL